MGVSIIVGGQFGSEGKGKVAREFVRRFKAEAAVRVGGPNSGHTVIDNAGNARVFRMLPTAAIDGKAISILPAGSYIDLETFLEELKIPGVDSTKIMVDPHAVIVTEQDAGCENSMNLGERFGSTQSGTGAAVAARAVRDDKVVLAKEVAELRPFLEKTGPFLQCLVRGKNAKEVIVEGTQGFGLSNLHSPYYPMVTSRDTTAAGFAMESGCSPFDITHVIMVLRSFPIRVPGNSGPLPKEMDWDQVTEIAQSKKPLREYTSVTQRLRRVAAFDAEIVREAIGYNNPDILVMNHLDYLPGKPGTLGSQRLEFIRKVQNDIGRPIQFVGIGPNSLLEYTGAQVQSKGVGRMMTDLPVRAVQKEVS